MSSRRLAISSLLCDDEPPKKSEPEIVAEPVVLAPHLRNQKRNMFSLDALVHAASEEHRRLHDSTPTRLTLPMILNPAPEADWPVPAHQVNVDTTNVDEELLSLVDDKQPTPPPPIDSTLPDASSMPPPPPANELIKKEPKKASVFLAHFHPLMSSSPLPNNQKLSLRPPPSHATNLDQNRSQRHGPLTVLLAMLRNRLLPPDGAGLQHLDLVPLLSCPQVQSGQMPDLMKKTWVRTRTINCTASVKPNTTKPSL